MKCPHCNSEISFQKICPVCGNAISYGGNTEIYSGVQQGKLSLKDIFSGTFKRHKPGDAAKILLRTSMNGAQMLSNWNRPWLYLRVFAVMLLLTLLMLIVGSQYEFMTFQFMWLMVACTIVPFTTMMFIWEMDIHGTVTILDMVLLVAFGGVLSIFAVFAIPIHTSAVLAPLTEEPAKLLICVLFILASKRKFYALDGLAIGAAVGAGFSFMETVDYVYFRTNNEFGTMIVRNFLSFFSDHVLYTAPIVGALCMAMNGEKLRWKHFANPIFLFMCAVSVIAHAMNNSGIPIMVLIHTQNFYLDIMSILVGVLIWSALLFMFRRGIKQALGLCNAYQLFQEQKGLELIGRSGQYANRRIPLQSNAAITFGRDSNQCSLLFAATQSTCVSRVHCVLENSGYGLLVRDLGSTNGTYINGRRLAANESALLNPGDVLMIGSAAETFEVA